MEKVRCGGIKGWRVCICVSGEWWEQREACVRGGRRCGEVGVLICEDTCFVEVVTVTTHTHTTHTHTTHTTHNTHTQHNTHTTQHTQHTHTHTHTQAVQNRLYDDYAALYYLLLNMWEKGQLQIPPSTPQVTPRPRLSQSGVPQIIPQINIDPAETNESATSPKDPWNQLTFSVATTPETESDTLLRDPNLARYLQKGRRHTLAAAHNYTIAQPDDLKRLRQISECSSSQASSRLGSSTQIIDPPNSLQQALSCGVGVDSQGSIKSLNAQTRLPIPSRLRMDRRVSDGGPYVAAYRMFMEKRNPLLAQLNSANSINRHDSSQGTNSVRALLERKAHVTHVQCGDYGQLPSSPWIHQVCLVSVHTCLD